jgi:hypothetical protein
MPANIQELLQATIDVPSTSLVRVNTISSDLVDLDPVVESDATEIGKGSEWSTEQFLTNWKTSKKVECYLSSELFGLAAAYGLGQGAGGLYVPIDSVTNANEIELPWMTVLEQIRPGSATQVLDRAFPGMIVNQFKITLGSGPGRANSKIEMDLMGTGKFISPSGLTMPAKTAVHLLPAASLTVTINGVDYITAKSFESFEFTYNNKLRDGYFPGSGFQTVGDPTSGQLMGRMEYGIRDINCFFTARYQFGSTELTSLQAQTAGSATIGLTGAAGNSATITMPNVTFKTAKIQNAAGIITVRVDIEPLVLATPNDVVSIQVTSALGTFGRA